MPLSIGERYLKWAANCRQNAISAKTADLKAAWLQLESAWKALAQRAEADQKTVLSAR